MLIVLRSVSLAQQVNWITFEELVLKMRSDPKPVLIFIHTDWCMFCALQEHNTFGDPQVVKEINQHFYALRLNGEEKHDITFLNKTYRYRPTGASSGYHELAELLARQNGVVSFPTTIILSKNFQVLDIHSGLLKAEEIKLTINAIIAD